MIKCSQTGGYPPQIVEKIYFLKILQILYPYPQTPSPREGAECGAAALTLLGATPQTPFFDNDRGLSTD